MMFFLTFILCDELTSSSRPGLATISFDEGPSKNISEILSILKENKVIATFHFNPEKIDNKSLVERIVKEGHTVGLAVTSGIDEVSDFDAFIKEQKELFIKATGYLPKYVRLPCDGYDYDHVYAVEQNGMIVTRPNLNSEDTDLSDFIGPFEEFVLNKGERSISAVFRDRMGITVRNLQCVLDILKRKYKTVGVGEFYGICPIMAKAKGLEDKQDQKKETKVENNGSKSTNDIPKGENGVKESDKPQPKEDDAGEKKDVKEEDKLSDLLNDDTVQKADVKKDKENKLNAEEKEKKKSGEKEKKKNKEKLTDDDEEMDDEEEEGKDRSKNTKNKDSKDKTKSSATELSFYYGVPLLIILMFN